MSVLAKHGSNDLVNDILKYNKRFIRVMLKGQGWGVPFWLLQMYLLVYFDALEYVVVPG